MSANPVWVSSGMTCCIVHIWSSETSMTNKLSGSCNSSTKLETWHSCFGSWRNLQRRLADQLRAMPV